MLANALTWVTDLDTQLFLFLNGLHNPFGDSFMYLFTGKIIWVPMYLTVLIVLFRQFHWKVALCYTLGIVLTIVLTDQCCGTLIRPVVERLRPAVEGSPIADLVHIVNGKRGGLYGFPSCHASNSFGLAVSLLFIFRLRTLTLFIFAWAFLNSYSRLYLGLHYPGDLLVGALIGSTAALLTYTLAHRAASRLLPSEHRRTPSNQAQYIVWVGAAIALGIATYSCTTL